MHLLCANPVVAIVDDVFDAELANHIISEGVKNLHRATVLDTKKGGSVVSSARSNSDSRLDQWSDSKLTELTMKLADFVRLPPEHSEPASFLEYKGKQKFDPHCDGYIRNQGGLLEMQRGGQRLFTTICYLNDVDKGGETDFPALKIKVKAKLGRVLIFGNTVQGSAEPHSHSTHAGRPVKSGKKYALTHWWRQLAFHNRREYPEEDGAYQSF